MEAYEIKWTSRAKKDLRKVYKYYTELAGEEKAFDIITTLLGRVDILSDAKYVKMGALDEQFSHLKRRNRHRTCPYDR